MPKRVNAIHQQILSGLIEAKPVSSTFKRVTKDADGKEQVVAVKVSRPGLLSPLAQNVSDENVDRLSRRWIR